MTASGGAPAGWYPDPAGGGGTRYWDGAAWTGYVSGTVPTSTAAPADWYPDPAGGGGTRYWDGAAWTAYVSAVPPQPSIPRRPASAGVWAGNALMLVGAGIFLLPLPLFLLGGGGSTSGFQSFMLQNGLIAGGFVVVGLVVLLVGGLRRPR